MRAPDWLTARPVAHRGLHDFARGIIENMPAAVAAAVSSGADRLEAAVVVSDADTLSDSDVAVLSDLGIATVLLAAPDGTLRAR